MLMIKEEHTLFINGYISHIVSFNVSWTFKAFHTLEHVWAHMPFKNDHNLVFTLILRNTKFHDYGYGKQIYFLCCTYKEQDNTYNMCEIEIYTKKSH